MKQKIIVTLVIVGLVLVTGLVFYAVQLSDLIQTNNQEDVDNVQNTMKPQSVKLAVGEQKTVGDLIITNTGDGHKVMMPEGNSSYAKVLVQTPRQVEQLLTIWYLGQPEGSYEILEFDDYLITVLDQEFAGELILSIKPKSETDEVRQLDPIDKPVIVVVNQKETKKVDNLSITNNGGGHKIIASDPTGEESGLNFTELTFELPGESKLDIRGMHTSKIVTWVPVYELQNILYQEIKYGPYSIVVLDVGHDGKTVELKIEKVKSTQATPVIEKTILDQVVPNFPVVNNPSTPEIKKGETIKFGELNVTNNGWRPEIARSEGDFFTTEITLESSDHAKTNFVVHNPLLGENRAGQVFGHYIFFVEQVGQYGDYVKIKVVDKSI